MDYILLKYLFLHVQNYAKYQVCTWPKKATWALGLEHKKLEIRPAKQFLGRLENDTFTANLSLLGGMPIKFIGNYFVMFYTKY